jgi:hypothetical protein
MVRNNRTLTLVGTHSWRGASTIIRPISRRIVPIT